MGTAQASNKNCPNKVALSKRICCYRIENAEKSGSEMRTPYDLKYIKMERNVPTSVQFVERSVLFSHVCFFCDSSTLRRINNTQNCTAVVPFFRTSHAHVSSGTNTRFIVP